MNESGDGVRITQKVRCRLVSSELEIRDDTVAYYNISQDNYVLLEIEDVIGGYGLKISAEWGPEPFHLTTRNRAGEILCQTGYGWSVKYAEEEEEGCWFLTKSEEADQYDARLYVRLSNLIVYREGVARLKLCYTDGAQEGPYSYIQLQKVPCALRIEKFEPETGTVRMTGSSGMADAALTWCVLGAERCVLNPGNRKVPPVGTESVSVTGTSVFTLSAFGRERSIEKSTVVYAYEELNCDLFQVLPPKYYAGCPAEISWKLSGETKGIQLFRDGNLIRGELPGQGTFTDSDFGKSYTLAFQRGTRQLELTCDREPDERESVLLFEMDCDERDDTFHLKWETFHGKNIRLYIYYRPRDIIEPDGVSFTYVDRYRRRLISKAARGDERWRLDQDKDYPVYCILRLENVYGEKVEKHLEYRKKNA